MSADKEFRFRAGAKVCGVVAVALLAFIALCPADWVPRTNLGFELDHFLAFFLVTSLVCIALPRPFVVGGALMVVGMLLEALQLLHRIAQQTFSGHSIARSVRPRRLSLLSSTFEYENGRRPTNEVSRRSIEVFKEIWVFCRTLDAKGCTTAAIDVTDLSCSPRQGVT